MRTRNMLFVVVFAVALGTAFMFGSAYGYSFNDCMQDANDNYHADNRACIENRNDTVSDCEP